MGRFLNPDNTAFKEIAKTKTYIDKTKLIELTNSFVNTPKNLSAVVVRVVSGNP